MNATQQPLEIGDTLEDKFYAWVSTPCGRHVMRLFIKIAVGFKSRGEKVGAKLIAERIRWHFMVSKAYGEDYKVNNNYVAYMSRYAMRKCDCLKGYFQTRNVSKKARTA